MNIVRQSSNILENSHVTACGWVLRGRRRRLWQPGGDELGHRGGSAMTDRPTQLDETDRTLIGALQRDGRASYADLAELVGLSPAATRIRVQRLLDAGVVRVVGVTDPLALGYPVMAALGVRVERNVRQVADHIAAIDGVIYVVFTSGSFDLLVEVLCEDSAALLAVIDDKIRRITGVRSVESFTYFGIHTHRFVWGAR